MNPSYPIPISLSSLRDLIGNAPVKETSKVCMSVINAIQDCPNKGSMLAGLTSAFVLLSEIVGISIPDMVVYSKNAMTDGIDRLPQFRACQDFIKHEIFNV